MENENRSDKRVRKCPVGHSELLIPTQSATKELEFDVSFEAVRNAKVKLWPLKERWCSRVVAISRKWS